MLADVQIAKRKERVKESLPSCRKREKLFPRTRVPWNPGVRRVDGETKENIYGKIFIPIQYTDSRNTEYSAKVIPISHT